MAEPLKNQYGSDVVEKIASALLSADPTFKSKDFIKHVLKGYEELELMDRAKKISNGFLHFLPKAYPKAIEVLLASLGPKLTTTDSFGMSSFLYLPHVFFVRDHGLDDFEVSMNAHYELTQRFTAEFGIRPYLERYPKKALTRLKKWAKDPSPHVRRLVSEGTRPRLPWAPRLRVFDEQPDTMLPLLTSLKDDVDLYVRRSVANHLNDIGKDHPELLVKTASDWLKQNGSPEQLWLVRHALRSLIKMGDSKALGILGYSNQPNCKLESISLEPRQAMAGDTLNISFVLKNSDSKHVSILVDLVVHFVKANGKTSPKVFKLKELSLGPKEEVTLQKKISLKPMTTRKLYGGEHQLDLLINGKVTALGAFELSI